MLTADPDLEFRTDASTGRYGKSNQLANPVPVEDLERIVGKYTTIHVVREEPPSIVPGETESRLG